MKANLKIYLVLCSFFLLENISAQDIENTPWQQRDRKDLKPIEYEYIREGDVMWSKNIWRMVDVRQKLNMPFAYPQMPLVQIIHEAAKKGEITVYDPAVENADQLKKPMPTSEVEVLGERRDTIPIINPYNPDEEIMTPIHTPLTWDRIKKFRIKEVWFFDTKTSTMQVRIIAIAPVMEDYDAQGNYRGDMTMYWVPYASLRNILATKPVFNERNDMQLYSWDDLFAMRKFESYIYKESNVHDRNIQEYAAGIDAHLESERIKQGMMEYEHDMWNY